MTFTVFSAHSMKIKQRIELLGSQHLSQLVDQLYCIHDQISKNVTSSIYTAEESSNTEHDPATANDCGFIYMDGLFYINTTGIKNAVVDSTNGRVINSNDIIVCNGSTIAAVHLWLQDSFRMADFSSVARHNQLANNGTTSTNITESEAESKGSLGTEQLLQQREKGGGIVHIDNKRGGRKKRKRRTEEEDEEVNDGDDDVVGELLQQKTLNKKSRSNKNKKQNKNQKLTVLSVTNDEDDDDDNTSYKYNHEDELRTEEEAARKKSSSRRSSRSSSSSFASTPKTKKNIEMSSSRPRKSGTDGDDNDGNSINTAISTTVPNAATTSTDATVDDVKLLHNNVATSADSTATEEGISSNHSSSSSDGVTSSTSTSTYPLIALSSVAARQQLLLCVNPTDDNDSTEVNGAPATAANSADDTATVAKSAGSNDGHVAKTPADVEVTDKLEESDSDGDDVNDSSDNDDNDDNDDDAPLPLLSPSSSTLPLLFAMDRILCKDMHWTVGVPFVYVHQEGCEHIIYLTNIHKYDPLVSSNKVQADDNSNLPLSNDNDDNYDHSSSSSSNNEAQLQKANSSNNDVVVDNNNTTLDAIAAMNDASSVSTLPATTAATATYPRVTYQANHRRRRCLVCDVLTAQYVVYGDRLAECSPCFYCE